MTRKCKMKDKCPTSTIKIFIDKFGYYYIIFTLNIEFNNNYHIHIHIQ